MQLLLWQLELIKKNFFSESTWQIKRKFFAPRLFAPLIRFAPPVIERVPLLRKKLHKKCGTHVQGANSMRPLSCGAQTEKIQVKLHDANGLDETIFIRIIQRLIWKVSISLFQPQLWGEELYTQMVFFFIWPPIRKRNILHLLAWTKDHWVHSRFYRNVATKNPKQCFQCFRLLGVIMITLIVEISQLCQAALFWHVT